MCPDAGFSLQRSPADPVEELPASQVFSPQVTPMAAGGHTLVGFFHADETVFYFNGKHSTPIGLASGGANWPP